MGLRVPDMRPTHANSHDHSCIISMTWAVLALAWSLGLQTPIAHAEGGRARDAEATPRTAESSEVQRLLKQAVAEFELGNWTEARALFERVHELQPTARTLRAIGLCAFENKQYGAAIQYLTAALGDGRKPLDASSRKAISEVVERAHGYVAQYTLELTPADATLRVDDREPIVMDGKLLLDPGVHMLTLTAEGYSDLQQRVVAQPRERPVLRLALQPRVALVESASLTAEARTPGAASAKASKENQPPSKLSKRQWIAIGVGSLGVASLAAGVATGLLAKSKNDDSGCESGACPDQAAKVENDKALRFANASTATFAIGGAALVAGALVYFVWPGVKPSEKSLAQLTPVFSPGFGGAAWRSTW